MYGPVPGPMNLPKLKEKIRHILTDNASPRDIATGASVGTFLGFFPFIPLFGLKTLLSYFISLGLRANTAVAVIAITLHDVLFFVYPIILRIEYQIGTWLLSHPHHFAPRMKLTHIKFENLYHWKTFLHVGIPTLLGSFVFGVVSAVLIYAILYVLLVLRKKRLAARLVKTEI